MGPIPGALALMFVALAASSGCGASLHAVYEGDVRFEHCMSLDAQPTVKPNIRRACWSEWVANYTYGQTRDRVVHAQLRIRQLSGVSDFIEPSGADASRDTPLSGPEPLTALGSPPATVPIDESPERDLCAGACREAVDVCSRECGTTGCHKDCSVSYSSCIQSCG
jgi:hypothetical protein